MTTRRIAIATAGTAAAALLSAAPADAQTTSGTADFLFVQARLAAGPHACTDAMFLVDRDTPGIEEVRSPLFSHTFDHHHPTLRLHNVFVPEANRLGAEGDGDWIDDLRLRGDLAALREARPL